MVKSTRANLKETSSNAILNGLAPDGGLYVFESVKKLELNKLLGKNYSEVANIVFNSLLDDFDEKTLSRIIQSTYQSELFVPSPVSVVFNDAFGYLNLYNGPTFAFKDMALSVLPKLVEEAKRINNITSPNLVLTATSGDTGSAALSGFSVQEKDHVIVLYPTIGVSEFQEKQMNNFQSEKLHIYAIDGNFDDCQNIVKELFRKVKTKNVQLTSANSINIGRIVPQVVYYVYTYLNAIQNESINFDKDDEINYCVPTGNFGNIYAAFLAKKMGVPIHKLIIASNQNDVLHDFFQTGTYNIKRELVQTMSPSMDIIISSNLERYIYDLFDGKSNLVNEKMTELHDTGTTHINEVLLNSQFYTNFSTEDETLETIKTTFEDEKILIDPHTAVAKTVYNKYRKETKDKTYTILVSTASPFKFSESVMSSLSLKKTTDLKDDIIMLGRKTKTMVDPRILQTFDSNVEKKQLRKSSAFDYLQKVIGDIDENQSSSN